MGERCTGQPTSRLLWKLLRSETPEVAVILTYGIGVGVLSLAVPVGVQALVNNVMFGAVSQPLLFLVLAVFTGLAVAAVFRTAQVVVVEKLQRRFFATIALQLANRIPRVRVDRLSGAQFPELVNRFFDVLVVQKSTAALLLEGFALILQTIIGLILLAFYHPALLAFDAVLIVAVIGIIFVLGRNAVGTAIEESVQKYRVAAWLEQVAGKSLGFSTSDARRVALRRADELVVGYLGARDAHFRILLRQIVGSLGLQVVASAGLLGLGAILVIKNQLTLGQLVAAEFVVTNVLISLSKLQKHLEAFYDLAAGLDKIEGLLELPLEDVTRSGSLLGSGPVALELRSVTFRYDTGLQLRPVSFRCDPKDRVALQGPNGSGKSTLMDILYSLKQPTTGTLLLNGTDVRELAVEELRRHVSLVRGIEAVSGSVFDNVAMGRPEITKEQAKLALERVGLSDEILRLPQGVDTRLTENGAPLSVAHLQLLMIARAIASGPRLLLIDESLDAIDSASHASIIDFLCDDQAPWTLVLCTHSSGVASRCNQRLVLEPPRDPGDDR